MKNPKLDNCPCCEVPVFYGEKRIFDTVQPFCSTWWQEANGRKEYALYWRCLTCGCEWEHRETLTEVDDGQ